MQMGPFAMRAHAGKTILFAGTVVERSGRAREVRDGGQIVAMALYSLLLMAVLVVGAPYWLARMVFSSKDRGRYRAGLGQRLGRVPAALRAAVEGAKRGAVRTVVDSAV